MFSCTVVLFCVADPGCFSRILGFSLSIPDLRSWIQQQQQNRRGKKIVSYLFFAKIKYHIIEFYFEQVKKKFWATKLSKIWVQIRDPQHWFDGNSLLKEQEQHLETKLYIYT